MYNGFPWPDEEFSRVTIERDLQICSTLSDHLKASHKALAKSPLFSKNIKGKRSPAQVEKELASVLKKVRSKLQQAEKLLQTLPSKKKEQETEPSDVADDERDDVEPQEDLEEDVA